MTALQVLLARLKGVFVRRGSDAALDEDIKAHLDLLAEDFERRGLSRADARTAARRAFGGVDQMKEVYRDQRGLPVVETLIQDLRYAARTLRRSPGFTALAFVTMVLGIFGPVVTFAMAKAWILDPLPFSRPDELLDVRRLDQLTGAFGSLTTADFLDAQRGAQSAEAIAGYRQSEARLTGRDRAERVRAALVTPNFFQVLGTTAEFGRVFDPASAADHDGEVVISHLMWREHLGADPQAVGRTVRLDGRDLTVIGVLPESFQFTLLGRCDVWRPLIFTTAQAADRRTRSVVGVARLRKNRTVEDARQELTQIAAGLAAVHPDTNANRSVRVLTLADEVRRHHDLGFIVPVMFAMVGCVLLIACVNITNVMLARASTRRQEVAVRLALGASAARLVRQWIIEHALVFLTASAMGAALAVYGTDWITQSIPVDNRQYLRNYAKLPVDRTVVLFALGIGALCAVVFGWFPAWTAMRGEVSSDLRDATGRSTAGKAGARFRAALVVSEVALALAVLISAGLLMTTARNITRVDVGFDPRSMLTFQLSLDPQHYRESAEIRGFYERLTADLRSRPGVRDAGAASLVPFGTSGSSIEFFPEGSPETRPSDTPVVLLSEITDRYAPTLGLRPLRGRLLGAGDVAGATRVAVVNETLVSRQFAGQDPIGRRFRLGRGSGDLWTVVGVVQDVKNFEAVDAADPQVYVPFAQQPRRAMTVVLRAAGSDDALAATARAAVAAFDPAEPLSDVVSMEGRIHRVTGPHQTISSFVAFFGGVTLLLAGVGVYGLLSYSFEQRTREIAIRVALGASRTDVAGLVLKQIRTFMLAGLAPGLLLAWGIGHALKAMLFGVTPTDWRLYLSMTLLLAAAALVAAFVPTRRAVSIDPLAALRDQ